MQGRSRNVCLGLVLGCLMGAIAACRNPSETVQQPVSTPEPTEQPTTPSEDSQPQTPTPEDPSTPDSTATPTPDVPTTSPNTATPSNEESATSQAESPVPPLPAECSNPQTQTDMNRCAEAEYAQADATLNSSYQALQSTLSEQKSDQLLSAEQAWIAYRDVNCDFVQTQFEGGSIQPTVYFGCLTQLTQARTAELEQTKRASIGFEDADDELNTVYQDLQAYLSPEEQALLTDAQLEWITYRDAHCDFEEGDMDACLAQVTETRVNQLQEQLSNRSL
ncbi:MAG: lysozyme inhibitor LprI family protein [Cyanobacteria bacterium J06636_16]